MTYTDVYLARHLARQHYWGVVQSGASPQAIQGALNLWVLADRRLRLTPRGPLAVTSR